MMPGEEKSFKKIKMLSLIFLILFVVIGLLSIFVSGRFVEIFINRLGYFFGTKGPLEASPLTIIMLKSLGGLFLMWAYLLSHLMKDPLKNAAIASASGTGFLILSIVNLYLFFSKEIMELIPPYLIAFRVIFSATIGLLFLIWTPRQP